MGGYFNLDSDSDTDYSKYDTIGQKDAGARKCSKCGEYKSKSSYNKEESDKPASKRICNDCGASLPSDLNNLTVAQLKDELISRDVIPYKGLKADLVKQLFELIDEEEPGERLDPKEAAKVSAVAKEKKAAKLEEAKAKPAPAQFPTFVEIAASGRAGCKSRKIRLEWGNGLKVIGDVSIHGTT